MKTTPGTQRLFQHTNGRHILLSKAGMAIFFRINAKDQVHIEQRLEDVDFKATGTQLIKDGWKCIGPGMEYAKLLADKEKI
ncbi:MAG: hypothetical protein U9O82_11975 [Thermodesulfobacteriota bacterium]|nr:hypothetical protein [Thermodesulfobacteriota bacterium]